LVEGDTNTVLAGSLAASKLDVSVGHVEAGLRSFDRSMPEEINRIVSDHVSDLLFAPTETARSNLMREGIPVEKIYVTGNTIVDAVYQNLELAVKNRNPLRDLGLKRGEYFLATAHRAENTDDPLRLQGILDGLNMVSEEYDLPVLYPIHPRTSKMIQQNNHRLGNIRTIEPVGYTDFLLLEAGARLIVTDSGGVQEEACILRVPCVTLRYNTERPETIENGANMLVGADPEKIVKGVEKMLKVPKKWDNPYGDGVAGKKICEIIMSL
jgi:UDP-N-acetylglucosamine 2-epimerase (non-hydrolysing)